VSCPLGMVGIVQDGGDGRLAACGNEHGGRARLTRAARRHRDLSVPASRMSCC